jgi:FolB domain-containing protein
MTDQIVIKGLRLKTRVGVTDEERAQPQPVIVDIAIAADLSVAGTSDDLADTVDYDRTVTEVAALVNSAEARLLEHLATEVASLIVGFRGVQGVTVEIAKETPPVAEEVERIAVRVERSR